MGFLYLFVFSFGMTALLVAVGLFSGFGAALPAAGPWMVWDEPVDFPVLWDEGGRAVRAFLAPGTSYIVVLDEEGIVVYTGSGAGQDIEAAVRTALD